MTAGLPPIYQQSKQSEYRKRLASVAIPPTETERRREEFVRTAYSGLRRIDEMGRGLVIDLEKFSHALERMGGEIEMRMGEDPFIQDLFHGADGLPDARAVERRWLSAFERHGFLFFPNKGLNCGLLLRVDEVLGEKNYLAALMENRSVQGSARVDGLGINIIDASSMLEDAAFKLNAFRFNETEPIASLLLSEGEISAGYGTARAAFGRRLGLLFGRSGMPDRDGIGKAIEELAHDRTEYGIGAAAARVSMACWSARGIQKDADADGIVHTVNLLNSLIANAFISYGLCGFLRGSGAGRRMLDAPESRSLSTLAGISFGEPYDKLAAITGGNLSGRPDHMLNHYLVRMNLAMGYKRGQGQKLATQFILTRSEAAIRKAALDTLQDELAGLTGRKLCDEQVRMFEEAGSRRPVSGEGFQRIAGVWAGLRKDGQ